jgi:hypothetical protein
MKILLNGLSIPVERDVFLTLFENSVVADYVPVTRAISDGEMTYRDLLKMSRKAEIPYPLFFAPADVVAAQVALKTKKLMAGFTENSVSMHSRHSVRLSDVELIVKDLRRKQDLIRKHDRTLTSNKLVGALRRTTGSIENDADTLLELLGLRRSQLRAATTKEAAIETFVQRLEATQVFVARSAQNHMPQRLPARVRFSGLTLKDRKIPFVFLASGDEREGSEPAGRRLFTLALMTVLIAKGRFAPVTYSGHTKDDFVSAEYDLAAEILMPRHEMVDLSLVSLESIKTAADNFKVTPSAMATRARRLEILGRTRFETYMDSLREEYNAQPRQKRRSLKPINAAKRYNGVECSRRMLSLLDGGQLSRGDFRRIMFFNKIPASQITAFREAIR